MKKIILIGGGGHCRVIIDAIKRFGEFDIYGITDMSLPKGTTILGVKVIGTDDLLPELFNKGIRSVFIAVGSIGDCSIRKEIYNNLKNIGFRLPVIIHPNAVIAEGVTFGEGTFIAAGVVINPDVKIGKNVIVNTSSSIDHDCQIGDFVHITPGVTLSGGVKIGSQTHIGIGAKIIQGINIGSNCMVKAGQLVCKDIPNNTTYSVGAYEESSRRE